jgi:hypothetical protein
MKPSTPIPMASLNLSRKPIEDVIEINTLLLNNIPVTSAHNGRDATLLIEAYINYDHHIYICLLFL